MFMREVITGGAALAVIASATAGAQQQDTSRLRTSAERRISLSKGEVAPRVDTVFLTRVDTFTRVDTVRLTDVRVDTVTLAPPPAPVTLRGPMYWGVFAGATEPWGNIDRVYTKGFHAGGVLGWEPRNGVLGLRFDGAVSQVGKEHGAWSTINQGSGTSLMMHLAGDLKLNPFHFGGWTPYAIGGVNYNRYKRIALASTQGDNCDFTVRGDCFQNANNESWSDKFGFNLGGGLDFHIGSQDMFLEARWFAIHANGARSWVLPISLGVRYF